MNYIGRLVTNVRGFYSEINSATLTGAIDVVVIRQEDGTFMGSPFHVRFGKIGVLRSREKIVDIEVNGNPVSLQMKLGDAGEAFFVEEIEEPLDSRNEMATSPIPPDDHVEERIEEEEEKEEEKKEETKEEEEGGDSKEHEDIHSHDQETSSKTDSAQNESLLTDTVSEASKDEALIPDDTPIKTPSDENVVAPTDTLLLKIKVDEPSTENIETTNSNVEVTKPDDGHVSDPETGEEHVIAAGDETTKEEETLGTEESVRSNGDHEQTTDDRPTEDITECVFPVSESITIPGREREIFSDSDSSNWMMESVSPSEEHPFRQSHLYPLSDLDSPIGSPPDGSATHLHVRPGMVSNPQHCLSDTELEIHQSQQHMNNRDDEVTWDWGKLPKGPENMYPIDRKIQDLKKEEIGHVHRAKRRDHHYHHHYHHPSSHKIREEGIYLDDLTSVDDEIARLYLNQALNSRKQKDKLTTEDRESGIGQSLPSSPSTEESGQKDTSLDTYQDIALSLCGELKNGKVPLESFLKHMVTFEDLSNNPSVLANPKLVIRINDRYYNWQIAAPMLMSYIVFQRPLEKNTVQSLIKQHMPKKEKRRSYYWFSWRQQQDDQSSDDEDEDLMKESKHRSRVHSNPRKHHTNTPTETELLQGEGDGEDQEPPHRQRNVSECTSGNESDMVNYRKTTRLSSEQLAELNLREGANSVEFSVTTKYQGTAACQATIYLWNFDDRIVISDIDGTITKSDVLGHILPVVGSSWAQSGVAHFFSSIQKNGYKLIYLSARAIGQAQLTRDYLKSVKQDQICLPDGPLLLSPASLIKAIHREVIEKKPEEFKISALRDILTLFPHKNPFYGGFGNKVNDVYSYRAVGVSLSRIFTINHKGEVTNELTTTFQTSYIRLRDLVDQMFPPYKKQQGVTRTSGLVAPEFSSFTYWRNPLPDIDPLEFGREGEEETTEPT